MPNYTHNIYVKTRATRQVACWICGCKQHSLQMKNFNPPSYPNLITCTCKLFYCQARHSLCVLVESDEWTGVRCTLSLISLSLPTHIYFLKSNAITVSLFKYKLENVIPAQSTCLLRFFLMSWRSNPSGCFVWFCLNILFTSLHLTST